MGARDRVELRWEATTETGSATGRADIAPSSDDGWHREYTASIPAGTGLRKLTLVVTLPPGEVWLLAPDRTFRPLSGTIDVSYPAGCFLVTRGEEMWRWSLSTIVPRQYSIHANRARVQLPLYSRDACGLIAWGEEKLGAPPTSDEFRFSADRLGDLSECIWFEPFPEGAKSALCLTDHADFDSVEKLQLLNPLFEKTGFRFTKSIFPHSDPHPKRLEKAEPGLDHAGFHREVSRLHESGVEIAFHGFSPRVKAPPVDECLRRAGLMEPFAPETWIDHGTGDYLFSRKGRLGNESLVALLDAFGIRNYWSYFDLWDNPCFDLSSWRPSTPARLAEEAWALWAQRSQTALARKHLLRHLFANVLGEHALDAGQKRSLGRAWTSARLQWAVRRGPPAIYGFDGRSLLATPGSKVVFDTTLLNHLAIQLAPPLLEKLAADSALCLAHSYLGWNPEFESNVFRVPQALARPGQVEVLPAFEENLTHAAELQRRRELVSLPFRELRSSLAAFAAGRMARRPDGWDVWATPGIWVGSGADFPGAAETDLSVRSITPIHSNGHRFVAVARPTR